MNKIDHSIAFEIEKLRSIVLNTCTKSCCLSGIKKIESAKRELKKISDNLLNEELNKLPQWRTAPLCFDKNDKLCRLIFAGVDRFLVVYEDETTNWIMKRELRWYSLFQSINKEGDVK